MRDRDAGRAFDALDHLPEALVGERLEQVVERVNFEGAQRVLVVRGDEDDDRRAVEQLQHFEAVELRHLDVEQEEVGIVLGDCLHRFESVRALGDDLAVLIRGQEFAQQLARRQFVVDDYGADHRGNSITTRNCPSASAACSMARPSETALSRPRAFSMPMPSPRASARSGSAGLSMTMRSM